MNTLTGRVTAAVAIAATAALLAGCAAATTPVAAAHTITPHATPAPVLGSRQHPFPAGTPGTYDPKSWSFTFLSTDANAWATVQTLDASNMPPAAGTADVLGTVKVDAAPGATPADPSSSVTYNYVGSDGNTYPTTNGCGSLGDQDLSAAGQMYDGATKTVLICAQMPTGAVSGGTWAVAQNYVNSTTPTVFFQGA